MLDVIEVGLQIQIDDARLLLDDRLSYPGYGFMCCPFRSISIRPRLEIRFENRLQDELQRPLAHSVTDSRNRKYAYFAPVLRFRLRPFPHGSIRVGTYFIPNALWITLWS